MLTGESVGGLLSSEITSFLVPTPCNKGEGYTDSSVTYELLNDLAESENLACVNTSHAGISRSERNSTLNNLNKKKGQANFYDLSHEEFADLYAQTLTFGIFTAVILSKGKRKFTRFDIIKTIPKTNIVLHELFEYISRENIPIQLEFIIIRIISDLQQMKSKKLLDEYLNLSRKSSNESPKDNKKFYGGPAPRRGEPIKSDSNGVQCSQANKVPGTFD